MNRAAQDLVLDALGDLAEHLRIVVVLRYYGTLSEREIATTRPAGPEAKWRSPIPWRAPTVPPPTSP